MIIAATVLGIGIDFSSLDPIKALFWSAVINGFVALPVMAAMMWVGSRRDQMGRFKVGPLTLVLGWAVRAASCRRQNCGAVQSQGAGCG